MIERIGPVCRFGPGGDYESVWPGEWMEQATQPKNAIGRLLDVISGMTDVIRGGNRCVEVIGPDTITERIVFEQENKSYESDERGTVSRRGAYAAAGSVAEHNSGLSNQPGLFADDWRAGAAVKHKPNNRIRAHRTTAKKRASVGTAVSFDESQGTLFELDFQARRRLKQISDLSLVARRSDDNRESSIENQDGGIPLVGRVAAGLPVEAVENKDYLSIESCFGNTGDIFALEVKGDSMIGENIREGDYVICKRTATASNGQLVVAIVDNEDATLKRFYKENNAVRLQPANEAYEPIYPENCQIQGVVIGLVRKL